MVVIRLARRGAKKQPFYHITASDRRAPRDGRYIEKLGYYNPIARGQARRLEVDLERIDHWIGEGAQVNTTVRRLIKEARSAASRPVAESAEEVSAVSTESVEDTVEEPAVEATSSETEAAGEEVSEESADPTDVVEETAEPAEESAEKS